MSLEKWSLMNKSKQDLVSILIPTYNSSRFIAEAIESALSQTYESVEIVISDNDSTDDTLAIAERYARDSSNITVNKNPRNQGPVRNWRRCVDSAKGEFTVLLFSDDRLAPNFVKLLLPYLSNPDVAFAYSAVGRIDQNGFETTADPLYQLPVSAEYPIKKFIDGHLLLGEDVYPVSPGCALFRTEDLKKNLDNDLSDRFGVGYMDHGAGPDLITYLLCGLSYGSFAYNIEKLAFFRTHDGNLSRLAKVNLAYALAKAEFASLYYTRADANNIARFRAAHSWRLMKLGRVKLYKKSLEWDGRAWKIAVGDWVQYSLKRFARKLKGLLS